MTNAIITPHSAPSTPIGGLSASATPIIPSSSGSNSQKVNIPTYEKPLHEKFTTMYKTLLDLKNNRNKYIDSKQVYQIYDSFLNLLNDLKLTRKDEELKGFTLNLPNANDLLIDDICQLLSLCFVTCGLIKFAPATYSSLSTVMKLLLHLQESNVYTEEDLQPIGKRLQEIRDIIINKGDKYNDDDEEEKADKSHQIEETLLRNKLIKCEAVYQELENNFKNIPSDLEPIYHKLIELRKNILAYITELNDKEHHNIIKQEKLLIRVSQFKQELKKIEKLRDESDGKFKSELLDPKGLDSIQAVLNGLIDECNNLMEDLIAHNAADDDSKQTELSLLLAKSLVLNEEFTKLNSKYESLYTQLSDLKLTLENVLVTRRWTLRETDLWSYQKLLKTIDEERLSLIEKAANIDPTLQKHFKKNQALTLYLVRRCYSIIYKLLESSEPVSESLTPIHNQLTTVKRCLLELKRVHGLNNLRELYPFQFKLASLDNLRNDGKFIVNNQIPEGQGTLNALLAECFDILQELKIELYETEDDDDEQQENVNGGSFTNSTGGVGGIASSLANELTDDEVEIKRNRFQEFNEADYDLDSESEFVDDDDDIESEYEGNDYY
ncbi:uncharacterized protein SPAPADRAFT_56931 [Spathaspora passalidarum NRRL Y-27907]|uniref:Uncharacterized protein n=1 Tax=Spathaspora passalidarum (strain NRRL Y-27907 / 11-Y1) TaxID=619300 RepID=G3ATN7_SPAPN|nr:uncharacterized protein SPAPADRAFT_56931 [Spathaspora passalidarum NRRL Y-27907]EGW31000.1 hypothetical protein SPAPADRAFT_56931 [Spathaspora passalidarum NRRL Y-27907]